MQQSRLLEIENELIELAALADAVLLSAHHINDDVPQIMTGDAALAANALPVVAGALKARLEAAHDRILELPRDEKEPRAGGESNPETGGSGGRE